MSLSTRARRPHARAGCRPRLESLEARTLLSGLDLVEPKIAAAATRAAYQVDGSGLSAAIIDTGADYTHPALGGDGFGPGHKVVDGWDFSQDKPNPYPVQPHGTMTAGLVASQAPGQLGVAPGAGIVALRVIGDNGSGNYDRVARALQYAIDNAEKLKISVVNISLSDGGNYSYDFFSRDNSIGQRVARLVHKLAEMRIPVVTAAGNSYNGTPGMGFTAILPETISVTATDKDDNLLPNAQRLGPLDGFAAATDLAAPGKDIEAPTGSNGYTGVEGSSFAAPLVTGGIILLQQIYQGRFGTLPEVDDLVSWLKAGATTLHDPVGKIDIGRLDIAKSASLIPKNDPPSDPGPLTEVYVDGVLAATVPSASPANPLADFGADAGFAAIFDVVQYWQNGQSATVATPPADSGAGVPGTHFDKVEIWNARPAGVDDGPADAPGAPQPASAETIRIGGVQSFRAKLVKAGRTARKPPGFASSGKRR